MAQGLGCREACGLLRSSRTSISCTPCICGRVVNHWTSREVPVWFLLLEKVSPLVKLPEIESGTVSCSAVSNCLGEHSPGGGHGHPLHRGTLPWRRAWPPTPVFLPGESHGQRSLAGYSPLGRKESATIKQLSMHDGAKTRKLQLKVQGPETSMVVQLLRMPLAMQRTWGPSPTGGRCGATTEPACSGTHTSPSCPRATTKTQ